MKYELEKSPHAVFSLTYHLVWCVKYRRKVLHGEIDHYLKECLERTAETIEIKIISMETDQDHVHVLFSCRPAHTISKIVNALKAVSARQLFKKYPKLKDKLWRGHLWNPAYFVTTTGQTT